MTYVFNKKGMFLGETDMHIGRSPRKHEGRGWGDASSRQRLAGNLQSLEERLGADFAHILGRNQCS